LLLATMAGSLLEASDLDSPRLSGSIELKNMMIYSVEYSGTSSTSHHSFPLHHQERLAHIFGTKLSILTRFFGPCNVCEDATFKLLLAWNDAFSNLPSSFLLFLPFNEDWPISPEWLLRFPRKFFGSVTIAKTHLSSPYMRKTTKFRKC
jgi:hypothetical protein